MKKSREEFSSSKCSCSFITAKKYEINKEHPINYLNRNDSHTEHIRDKSRNCRHQTSIDNTKDSLSYRISDRIPTEAPYNERSDKKSRKSS